MSGDKPRLTEAQKKQNHIESEKKRREAIREGFDGLADIVPGMKGQGRSESVVLQATVQYLKKHIEKKEDLRKLAFENGLTDEEFENVYANAVRQQKDNAASPSGASNGQQRNTQAG